LRFGSRVLVDASTMQPGLKHQEVGEGEGCEQGVQSVGTQKKKEGALKRVCVTWDAKA
jgi:hypothetical protein